MEDLEQGHDIVREELVIKLGAWIGTEPLLLLPTLVLASKLFTLTPENRHCSACQDLISVDGKLGIVLDLVGPRLLRI